MRVMVLVKADKNSEAGAMPQPELLAAMMNYNEELVKAGVMIAGEGLKPSSQGVRVRFSGETRTVTDGPFAETSELVAGFWIWEVASMEEAIAWAKRCPNPQMSDSDLEIRPLFGMEDFAEVSTPEIDAQSEQLAKDIEQQHGRYM
ncbi:MULTISPECIES: YciI family protein [unclassified Sphingopyxis]|uniref:YciI family protein n=1 Tax=unclassified Sphingopyxis TaxID=2614943 RepID=UPI000730A556|nr:dehydrogenase [Sphingopyxis sp. H057]KTE52776.1 dehydrogenase [Sphingopyxis sp. H073]KTE54965.1 dehydrogenase [Sphingopyxis sp. H071]KTE62426.1 dehydrogenase [Sphingopyxis sp. H107]KTE65972.1 dehydrogenase [Sphingopyxis sp. H100]KTE73525.1 dehydrogenase [Sphingopyxis sp. H081]KTE80860.1 dehydrogenase [Sphingopyxis sp. H067]MBD3734174.1 YciI family protein [Sphingopyxis sp.]